MQIKKNVFDNIFNIMMDIKGKSKDNVKVRMDLKEYCKRPKLELLKVGNGKVYKPKAKFSFIMEQKCIVCKWVKNLRMQTITLLSWISTLKLMEENFLA